MQRSKTALVLAGGGVAGAAYEIGAICALDQLLDQFSVNEFDIYVGTSAGGLISSCLANNISPRTLLSVLDSSLLGIEQLEPQHLFAFNLEHLLQRLQRLPTAFGELLRRMLRGGGSVSVLDLLETISEGLPAGLYDTLMLERYLRSALTLPGRSNRFVDLPQQLRIVATELDSGERAVFGQPPLQDVPISLAVCASAAIPIFYRPVRIGDHDYIDGGIRGTASLDVAIELGAELIICINPLVPFDNRNHAPGHSIRDEGIQQIGNQVFRTFIHAGLHYHMKQVRRRHPKVDIVLIEPTSSDSVMFNDNTMRYQTRMNIARHGYESVANHLCEHYTYYCEMMARHGMKIRNDRISQDLYNLMAVGQDAHQMRAALAADGALHTAPAGLAHTLAELDRVLTRMETTRKL
ncbi:MAG: patatin family protein [Candidatus Viridilinea halotolerans]|uniref:Patatin family protein n=1 Tax=Candidatus Viridilinea halotolerans TaxID=2491704 RepID=A0A426TWU5_9CHLR|nr:MAG: patatin family protein [Candidatus Viridilinea halotolerans]